jgi:hypothetical protein
MSLTIKTKLRAAKDPSRQLELAYRDIPVTHTQARLAGRRTLEPILDLHEYKCRAAMDVVSITFEFARETQFRYVQSALEPLTGRRLLIVPSSPGPGGSTNIFTVVFQEPTLSTLQACHDKLQAKFGEVSAPFVNEVEISVDFTPVEPSDDSRARMVAVLARHLYPTRNFFQRTSTRPRYSWGTKLSQNNFILKGSTIKLDDNDPLLNTAGDCPPPIDATYYIGHRKIGPLWRTMDKILDRQHRTAGTFIVLSDSEKRARVEVRLDRLELKTLKVTSLEDLLNLNFAALQRRYFKFMLPTFLDQTTTTTSADRHLERARLERFLHVGVLGLRAMDEQRRSQRAKLRPTLVNHVKDRSVDPPAIDRSGVGPSGSFIAYKLMNDRVSMALRKLVERERRKLL